MKLTRRDLIRYGAGVSLVAAGGGWGALMADSHGLIEVTIPSSGRKVPAVGIGTVSFRGAPGTAEMAPFRETLEVFHRLGGRLLDTSPNYGNSEQVLGHLLPELGLREDVFMATKVDREERAAGIERMEGSVERLGLPIDLMQVHNLRGTREALAKMREWKQDGRIRYIGITTSHGRRHAALQRALQDETFDFVQFTYNIIDREAEQHLLPLAHERGVAVIINRPFRGGDLFGLFARKPLPDWASEFDCDNWAQFFLKFIAAHPDVTCIIPATSKVKHMVDNMAAGFGRLPDAEMRERMAAYFAAL